MTDVKKYISKEELKTHNKIDDLWISIEGKIYDVTNWVNNHPGGDLPLLYFAGQDATDVFMSYHPVSSWKRRDEFFTGFYLDDYKVSAMSKDYRKLFFDFQKMGLFENKGHGTFITICILLMMFCVCVYGVLSSNDFRVHLACAGLLGGCWIQLGWIAHDTAHYQVMTSPELNNFALFVYLCFAGISPVWWKRDHNSHHIASNSLEYDPNTQVMPGFVLSSKAFTTLTSYYYEKKMNIDSLTRFLVSYQHWTLVPSVAFLRYYFYIHSFEFLLSNKKVPNKLRDCVGVLVFFTWFSLIVSCLPNLYERVVFVSLAFGVTGIQVFQLSFIHIPCDAYVGPVAGDEWLEKQINGTMDVISSPWMDWFHGGIQFQIEHHLFPRMPRCQLRTISPYVQELCKKHNVDYKYGSFWEACKLTFNTLRSVALHARNFTDPIKNK